MELDLSITEQPKLILIIFKLKKTNKYFNQTVYNQLQ